MTCVALLPCHRGWDRGTEGPRWTLLSENPNFSSARMCTGESGGENLTGREKAWENHQASSLGAGGHVCTAGRLGPAEKQPQTMRWKVRQGAGRGGHRPRSQGDVQCTHTCTHVCAHTFTQVHSHTYTHAHSALTFILHAPPLTLTYTRVLTSGSWLRSEGSNPQGRISPWRLSPGPTYLPLRARGCVPGPTPGCLHSLSSRVLLGKAKVASDFGWRAGSHRSEGVQKGTEQLALHHGTHGPTTPTSPDLRLGGGRIADRQRPGVASGSTDLGSQPWGVGPQGECVLATG